MVFGDSKRSRVAERLVDPDDRPAADPGERSQPIQRDRVAVTPIDPARLLGMKRSFTTRRVPISELAGEGLSIVSGKVRPRAGDLVIARVSKLGHHSRLELNTGRRARLNLGDEILVAYGNRYAPDQFESIVPLDLSPTSLVASGGIASTVLSKSGAVRRATQLAPVGLLADQRGTPINLADYRLDFEPTSRARPPVLVVLGTSMNSGKTTVVKQLVRGLALGGDRPGATKVTGTGSGNDFWAMVDAGGHVVTDFTDAGYASTYRLPFDVVEAALANLIDHLSNQDCTHIVVEIADGLFQPETAWLLTSDVFRSYADSIIFAAGDAIGAISGVERLRAAGLPVIASGGLLTRSPLAVREAQANTNLPVITRDMMADPEIARALLSADPSSITSAMEIFALGAQFNASSLEGS